MTTTSKLVTAEDILAMGEKGRWLELYEGEVHAVSPANMRHSNIAARLTAKLMAFVEPRNLGYVGVEGGYVLRRNPDTLLGPDVSFLRKERAPDGLAEKFFEGPPDLAVEIISPRNPRPQIETKMKTYMAHGTLLGWLVDPTAETVQVYRSGRNIVTLTKSQSISGEDVLPGFICPIAEFLI